MSLRKTYLDSGVLINAFRGITPVSVTANQILNDPEREFASSLFVQLETLPKVIYHKQQEEMEFYETFFESVRHWVADLEQITQIASRLA